MVDTQLPKNFTEKNNVILGLDEHGLFHIKINRPEKMNALYKGMYDVIREGVDIAAKDENVRVLIIYGSNGVFCAGNDLQSFIQQEPAPIEYASQLIMKFVEFPKPLVFFVQKACVGIISALASHADFIYCSDDAFFLLPFMQTNLCPEGLSSIKYPELVGRRKASEMIFCDHQLKAKEALQYGFINAIIPKDQIPKTEPLLTEIEKIPNLKKLLSQDPKTVQNAKKLLIEGQNLPFMREHNMREQTIFYDCQLDPKFKETMKKYAAASLSSQKQKERPKL
ncbi:enoyl-hydratase [Stylonychia lemnae]|uniref:Enoyl-hydratase n=1 Tax=Stylonychia lemnae TaxID=5949 RepID=A0A078AX25_STYLE|nr:enoyl-hydratase [Stylonychia lemnae]|eukprot:CDW86719.1 enoyl-hydratase [Stylonychia lemnae]